MFFVHLVEKEILKLYNWEKGKKKLSIILLKASKSDIKSNTQYYTLDEDGLELVFATKGILVSFNYP